LDTCSSPDVEAAADRGALSLSRFYNGSGSRKTSSTRSSPRDATVFPGKEVKHEKRDSKDSGGAREKKDSSLLNRRISSALEASPTSRADPSGLKKDQSIMEQIGTPDHRGWMRKKGEHYNTWKNRYVVLKGPHLYWLKSGSPLVRIKPGRSRHFLIQRLALQETKLKGYVHIVGYRIVADENVDPGRYGFKLTHESDRAHFFSSDDHTVIREWMKALMKATIDRDYSSAFHLCNSMPKTKGHMQGPWCPRSMCRQFPCRSHRR
jgi:PH domain